VAPVAGKMIELLAPRGELVQLAAEPCRHRGNEAIPEVFANGRLFTSPPTRSERLVGWSPVRVDMGEYPWVERVLIAQLRSAG